jgi:hypothetical protein
MAVAEGIPLVAPPRDQGFACTEARRHTADVGHLHRFHLLLVDLMRQLNLPVRLICLSRSTLSTASWAYNI